MYKRLTITLVATACFILLPDYGYSINWIPKDSIIIKGGYNSPPFEFINEKGKPDGFNIDLIEAIMADLGWDQYKIVLDEYGNTYNRIISSHNDSKENAVFLGMIYTSDMSQDVRFSLPLTLVDMVIVTGQDAPYKNLKDLSGKRILAVSGSWSGEFLQKDQLSEHLILVKNIPEALTLLTEGKADALIGNESIIRYFIKSLKIKHLKILSSGISPLKYTLAIPKGNEDLLYQINLSIQRLKTSGIYDSIYDKWFGVVSQLKIGKIISVIFLSLSAIVILMMSFVWVLRRQVKQATRMLSASKQELEMAFDAGKISAWTYDIETKTISKLRGDIFEDGETLDLIFQKVHPEDIPSLRAAFHDLSTGKRLKSYECFRIKKGTEDDFYSVYEIIMARGEKTREAPVRIAGTLKDVTEEITLKNKLEDYKLKSSFIVETNEITLVEYDILKQIFINVTKSEDDEKLIGYARTDYLQLVHPEDLAVATVFLQSMEEGTEEKLATEFRFLNDNREYQWYSINTVAYKRNENGEIISYLGLRRNNNSWKKITEDLIALRNKAEASNKLKSAFLANMSHEIRTPLNAIVGFSGLIVDSDNQEDKEQYHTIIKTNSELLLQLIDDILDLSKIEAGYLDLKYKAFNLGEYLSSLCSTLALRKPHGVDFVYSIRDFSINLYSDKNRIGQIITNFVVNAFKFTSNGSVTLEYNFKDEHLTVTVTDTGIGISKKNLPKVFGRFEKLNDFAQGTGLGLPICKALANAMNGDIYAESQEGKGSKFTLSLPCNLVPENTHPECITKDINLNLNLTSQGPTEDECNSCDKKHLLIAEDIDNNYMLAYKLLKNEFNIVRANNGEEAVEYVRNHPVDYILMDMKMPVMDGLEATQKIREFNKTIPIIALTAYVLDTDRKKAHESGCSGFLSKPLNKEHLLYELNIVNNA